MRVSGKASAMRVKCAPGSCASRLAMSVRVAPFHEQARHMLTAADGIVGMFWNVLQI